MKEFFFSLRSYNGVSRKSNGCFNEASRIFHASFMDKKFQRCFKKVFGVFLGCLRELCTQNVLDTKFLGTQNFYGHQMFSDTEFVWSENFL